MPQNAVIEAVSWYVYEVYGVFAVYQGWGGGSTRCTRFMWRGVRGDSPINEAIIGAVPPGLIVPDSREREFCHEDF